MANKRYYWLKLHDDFFKSKRIKKLRKLGSDFVIIYLKMQLLSLQNNGILEFSGIEDDFASEIALDIDEDVDKVQLTISYLQSCGLLECTVDNEFFLPYVEKLTGSETQSTIRSRKSRENKALEQLSIKNALQCNTNATKCNRDIDIELDIDKDIDIKEKDNTKVLSKKKNFVPPTVEEVSEYCDSRNNGIDANNFVDYYSSKGWMIGKNKMKDWKAAVRTWERNHPKDKCTDPFKGMHENAESNFNKTFEAYPNKNNSKESKIAWCKAIKELGDDKNACYKVYKAMKLFLEDFQSKFDVTPKSFDKFLESDLEYWLEK